MSDLPLVPKRARLRPLPGSGRAEQHQPRHSMNPSYWRITLAADPLDRSGRNAHLLASFYEAFILAHHEVRLDLLYRIQRHAHQDQQ